MYTSSKLKIFSVGTTMFLLMACTDGVPISSRLRNLQDLDFEKSEFIAASLDSMKLKASCSSFVSSVEISFDSGKTWISPADHDPSAKNICENGSFIFNIIRTNAPLKDISIPRRSSLHLQFRIKMVNGDYQYKNLSVKYLPPETISREIFAGAQTQIGIGIQARGRMRATKQSRSSGGNFVLRGRIVQ